MIKAGSLFLVLLGTVACCNAQSLPAGITLRGDSATIAAGLKYKNPSFFKRLFLGKNYRTTWATPVALPVFHLTEMGFAIKELGGGQQTKSLRLLDKQGHEWALRTIDKDVEKALPPFFQNTIAEKVVQDMVSAAHPYAPLIIPQMAQATGVIASAPVFFFVPDDPALGKYRELFKNTMCMLEEREPAPDKSDTKNTEELIKALLKNNETQVAEEAVLRARLLDMLLGDWDRHQDQWRWGIKNVAGVDYGYAIPRDRDQALFYSNGLLVKLARVLAAKHLVGFAKSTANLKKLNAKSWNFDRAFLNGLNAADWNRISQQFAAALPDSLIHEAVKKMPPEAYPLTGALIEKKLISRRNSLPKDALRYQRFLASSVTITGTDEAERFVITTAKDSITIQQFSGRGFSKPIYNRTFHRSETYQILILGLDGPDEFIQTYNQASRIRLLIDGGKGRNQYNMKRHCKLKFYDSGLDGKSYLEVLKKELKIKD